MSRGRKSRFESRSGIFTRPDMFVFTLLEWTRTPKGITGEVADTGDLCPACCCRIMAWTKWAVRHVKWSQKGKRGLQTQVGKKLAAFKRFTGSPFLNSSCFRKRWGHGYGCLSHLRGIQNGCWLRRLSCGFCRGGFSSFLRAGAESRSARGLSLWIIKVKLKIGNDLAFV